MEIAIAGLAFLVGYAMGCATGISKCKARIERMKKIIDSLMTELVNTKRIGI